MEQTDARAICATPGLDAVYVGPADLYALGARYFGDPAGFRKEHNPLLKAVAVEPESSPVLSKGYAVRMPLSG